MKNITREELNPVIMDESFDNDNRLRPILLNDFIGQNKIKENLKIFIESAKKRKVPLDHVLVYGPPGLGKTTISQIIANEMGVNIKITSGPVITKSGDLAALLTNLEENDILFIDEIHRLSITVEEILYSAMEDFKLDIMIGEGPAAKSIRIDLPKFTLVGATTRFGLISNPLRDRFLINLQMEFYNEDELLKIVSRTADILKIKYDKVALLEIAKRSRGTPRIVNRLIKRVRDFLEISNKNVLDKNIAEYSLEKLGIDNCGLDSIDIKYLKSIANMYDGGPVGVDTLVAILSESKDTIEDVVEPFLLQKGFIAKTPRGRMLNQKAFNHLGIVNKKYLD